MLLEFYDARELIKTIQKRSVLTETDMRVIYRIEDDMWRRISIRPIEVIIYCLVYQYPLRQEELVKKNIGDWALELKWELKIKDKSLVACSSDTLSMELFSWGEEDLIETFACYFGAGNLDLRKNANLISNSTIVDLLLSTLERYIWSATVFGFYELYGDGIFRAIISEPLCLRFPENKEICIRVEGKTLPLREILKEVTNVKNNL